MVRTVSQALEMLEQKPWRSTMLAAHLTGNAHALDANQPLGKLLQAATETLGIVPPLRDGVSSTVLCANVLGADWLEAASARALCLTWREVNTLQSIQAIHKRIWIVENPSVFEGLLEHLQSSATLFCTSGQPSAAAWALLDRLEPQTELWVHCDFDLGGLRIAASLQQRYPNQFHPWRFDSSTYLATLERTPGLPLSQPLPSEPFSDLVGVLLAQERAIHQELLLDVLLLDIQNWLYL